MVSVSLFSNLLSKLRLPGKNGRKKDSSQHDRGPRDWGDDLNLTLQTLQESHASKAYDQVHAITLSNFKESIGPLWDAYQDKIVLIADTTIDRMLSRDQTVIRQDEDTWLLILPDLTPGDAKAFANSIAVTIGNKLIGARFDDSDEADPTPGTALVDLSNALNSDGTLNKDELKRAVSAARAIIADQTGREIRQRNRRKQREDAEKRFETERTKSKSEATGHAIDPEQGLQIVYTPAWSADSQSIDSFYCRPLGTDGGDPFQRDDPGLVTANAIAFCRACVVALNAMIQDSVRAKLVVPIPFQVLATPAQHQILNSLTRLEESHRFLYLRPEIVHVPHSASATDLLNTRDLLSAVGRDICVFMNLMDLNRAVLSVDRIMLGCDVPRDSGHSSTVITSALESLKKMAGRRSTYALGLPDRHLIKKAVELGFAEVSGPDLQPTLKKRPSETIPFPRDRLLDLA